MYLEHFKLATEPFSIAPDPEFLFLSNKHNEALSHLLYGLSNGGFVLLTGEVGTGKTTLLRNLLKTIPPETNVAFILNPRLTVVELLETICDEFGIELKEQITPTVKNYIDALNKFLIENNDADQSAVLIIDEAQNLSTSVLEQIRLLTNIETDNKKLLQIVLIGQPELEETLSRKELRQLTQRITARYRLEALTKKETKTYIEHRLAKAGKTTRVFKSSAIATIFRTTQGIPRLINLLCDRAMLGAYSLDLSEIDSSLIRQSKKEVFGVQSKTHNLSLAIYLLPLTALVMFSLWYFVYDVSESRIPSTPDPSVSLNSRAGTSDSQKSLDGPATKYRSWLSYKQDQTVARRANSRSFAFAELYAIWGHTYQDNSSVAPCEFAPRIGLTCLKGTGTWNDISNLDTPVVLELWIDFDKPQYALLAAETKSGYSLIINSEKLIINKADLNNSWFGSFETLWQPPPNYEKPLALGDQHPSITWLKKILASNYDYSFDPGQVALYNQKLLTFIEDFQRQRGLIVDGVIGPLTWIKLSEYLNISSPTLKAKS